MLIGLNESSPVNISLDDFWYQIVLISSGWLLIVQTCNPWSKAGVRD